MKLIILIIILTIIRIIRYSKDEYKKETGIKFFKMKYNKGCRGEYLIYKKLEKIEGYKKILVNVYIPKEDGTTTETDIIFLHESGIYVIESKNYSGWIFGNSKQKFWTETFKRKKIRFFNPIWQNETHINHLKKIIPKGDEQYYYSFVVFANWTELKKIDNDTDTHVIRLKYLKESINRIIADVPIVLNKNEINNIYNILKKHCNATEEQKLNHINNIKKKNKSFY